MKIIRVNSEKQASKLDATMTRADVLNEAYSCEGECNDCENCGGVVTH